MNELTYRKATPADWPAIAGLLTASGLPLAGAEEHVAGFLLAVVGGELVGASALERYGEAALLRSVAVGGPRRSGGLGQELVRRLLDDGRAHGVRTVALLTTTAERFFPRFGFRRADRMAVPAALQASAEFQGACPDSSVCMLLDLSRPAILVRPIQDSDLPAVTRIYNQGIEDRATLETEQRTVAERREWLAARTPRHPVIVAVQEGEVRGWASLNPFTARQAYRFVADLSVYVERDRRGAGIGTALMRELEERARRLDYHKLVLTTFPFSTAAVRLYESLGYRHVGDYREQGMLDGRWVDTRVMEKLL